MGTLDLENRKALIINALQLGMDFEKVVVLVELSQLEVDLLRKDKNFQAEVRVAEVQLEADLLERFKKAMVIAANKGNTKSLEFMLSRINPDRWGPKQKETIIPGTLIISQDDESLR